MRRLPSELFCWIGIIGGAGVMAAALLVRPLFGGDPPDLELGFSGAFSVLAGVWLRAQRRLPPRR